MAFRDTAEIIEANRRAGGHYFDRDTVRFFQSRIGREVYGGCFFVTSERHRSDPRRFSVRYATEDGNIHTASAFQQYATRRGALEAAKTYSAPGTVALPSDAASTLIFTLFAKETNWFRGPEGMLRSLPDTWTPRGSFQFDSQPLNRLFWEYYSAQPCRALHVIHRGDGARELLLAEIDRHARSQGLLSGLTGFSGLLARLRESRRRWRRAR